MNERKQPKVYTVGESYTALVKWSRSIRYLLKNRKTKAIDPAFIERLMLAVTEVNGCAVCAYGHTKMALNQGFTQEEITAFLSGNKDYVKPEERQAILFAQHYADTKGIVDHKTHETILTAYGESQTKVILAAIQMMMIGNIGGLPISAFHRRSKGKPDPNSSLTSELGLPLISILLMVPAVIHGILETMTHQSMVRFETSQSSC